MTGNSKWIVVVYMMNLDGYTIRLTVTKFIDLPGNLVIKCRDHIIKLLLHLNGGMDNPSLVKFFVYIFVHCVAHISPY